MAVAAWAASTAFSVGDIEELLLFRQWPVVSLHNCWNVRQQRAELADRYWQHDHR